MNPGFWPSYFFFFLVAAITHGYLGATISTPSSHASFSRIPASPHHSSPASLTRLDLWAVAGQGLGRHPMMSPTDQRRKMRIRDGATWYVTPWVGPGHAWKHCHLIKLSHGMVGRPFGNNQTNQQRRDLIQFRCHQCHHAAVGKIDADQQSHPVSSNRVRNFTFRDVTSQRHARNVTSRPYVRWPRRSRLLPFG